MAAPIDQPDGQPDPRTLPERRLGGLLELVRIALGTPDLPDTGGARPTVVVTVPLASLLEHPHLTTAEDLPHLDLDLPSAGPTGYPISPATARRLACDAKIIPAVMGGRSEPLDVGRAAYTVPSALRRAVILRDRCCRFPGCHRRPRTCHVHHIHHWADGGTTELHNLVLLCSYHHITHWADGGRTELHNLVLLCSYHHHQIHTPDHWHINHTSTGPEFVPPQWIRGP